MTMGDRIEVMNNGQVQQVGPPVELYEKPANLFVAGFIGSPRMNLHSKERLLEASDQKLAVLDERLAKDTVLGIRPEHVFLQAAKHEDLSLGLGRIERVEDLGHEALVKLITSSGLALTARINGEIRHQTSLGDQARISIPFQRLHAFSSGTGFSVPVFTASPDDLPKALKIIKILSQRIKKCSIYEVRKSLMASQQFLVVG